MKTKFAKKCEWKWKLSLQSIVNRREARGKSIPHIQAKASHILSYRHVFEIVNIIMLGHLLKSFLSDITSQTYNKILILLEKCIGLFS